MASLHGQLSKETGNMDEDAFKKWGVEKLKVYLLSREVPIGNMNKQGLVNLTHKLGLKVVKTIQASEQVIEKERLGKLKLEEGRIILPVPDTLSKGWEDGAINYSDLSQSNA